MESTLGSPVRDNPDSRLNETSGTIRMNDKTDILQ